jgi:leader peptidase (prepilin peptidase) / N-methyltransferase
VKALIPLPAWTILFGLAFGAVVGSFLNVVIYRMPRGKSLSDPKHSFCPKCNHRLNVPDLFPLLSWLFSRGRCRYCGKPVTSRYFWVELLNGAIWAGIWYQFLLGPAPDPGKAIAYALAASALVAIIFIDIELYMIPDQVNAFILFVGLGYNLWLYAQNSAAASTWGIPSSVAGALVGVGVLWGIAFLGRIAFRKDAMGHGDIKMARGIGAVLFPALAGISFGLAVALGAVIGGLSVLPRILSKRKGGDAAVEDEIEEPDEAPESIGSLLKCGLGYILCFDVIGLFFPKFYISYFGEDPFAPAEEPGEGFQVEMTMIPFGPYLALGAIIAAVFERELQGAVHAYLQNLNQGPNLPGPAFLWNTLWP